MTKLWGSFYVPPNTALMNQLQELIEREHQIVRIQCLSNCTAQQAKDLLDLAHGNYDDVYRYLAAGYGEINDPDLVKHFEEYQKFTKFFPPQELKDIMSVPIDSPEKTLKDRLQIAFDLAEHDTSSHFEGRTCSMENKDGKSECPICYFRLRTKHHLGLDK